MASSQRCLLYFIGNGVASGCDYGGSGGNFSLGVVAIRIQSHAGEESWD